MNGSERELRFIDRIYKELVQTQERRQKLEILKITFVVGLLGFGGLKLSNVDSFWIGLLLVPLVTAFFDLLIDAQNLRIRRKGAFLRTRITDQCEKEWQRFVLSHRTKSARVGSWGFTLISYAAAAALLLSTVSKPQPFEFMGLDVPRSLSILFIVVWFLIFLAIAYLNRQAYKTEQDKLDRPQI